MLFLTLSTSSAAALDGVLAQVFHAFAEIGGASGDRFDGGGGDGFEHHAGQLGGGEAVTVFAQIRQVNVWQRQVISWPPKSVRRT